MNWKKSVNPLAPIQLPKKDDPDISLRSVDYLRDLRVKRNQEEIDGTAKPRKHDMNGYEKALNNPALSDHQKLDAVRR